MKDISSSLMEILKSSSPCYAKKLLLYLRVWDSTQNAFIYGSPYDITPYLISCGTVKWKLDNEGYGIWNSAGLCLTLSSGAPFLAQGTLLYGARIDVYGGASSGGSAEYVKIFRGFILRDSIFNPDGKSCTVYLNGELSLLSCQSAQSLSISREKELVASRPSDSPSEDDTSYLSFTLSGRSVAGVDGVFVGDSADGAQQAAALREVNDYEVSSLNSYKYPATVTLSSPLAAGKSIWVSYRCWHTDKSIEWAVANILTLCGVRQTEIEEVDYEGDISSFFNQPADEDFTQGFCEYGDVTSSYVKVASSFLQTANYDWRIVHQSNVPITFTPCSITLGEGNLSVTGSVAAPSTQAYGTWELEADSAYNEDIGHYFFYVSDNEDYRYANGYCVAFTKYDYYQIFFVFYKVTNGTLQQTAVKYFTRNELTNRLRYRIGRDSSGTVRLWVRPLTPSPAAWVDLGVVFTDTTYTTCSYHIAEFIHKAPNSIYDIKLSPQPATGSGEFAPYAEYLSPVIDGGRGFLSWGNFTAVDEPDGCQSSFYSRSKDTETSAWGAWHSLSAGTAPQESGRYLQLKWYGGSDSAQTKGAKLDSWQISWQGDGVNIAVINTGGLTCLDAVKELAVLSGYQIGFDCEGKFFFKKRPALTSAVMQINKTDILNLESLNSGGDKLYNRVRVNFGSYDYTVDEFTSLKPRPNLIDKYGVKELALTSGNFLPAQNADLARACAPVIFGEVSKLKKRAVVICRFLPQIDLGDIVCVDYAPYLQGNMLVEGVEFDLSAWTVRLDLCSWE